MGKVAAICTSPKKGTAKYEVEEALLIEDFGIKDDAHAGKWHRQVSLLELKKIEDFNAEGGNVKFGDFGENIVVDGIEVDKLDIGQKLKIGDVILEITQIGKKCHSECEIFHRVGKCIMPIHGVFSKVLKGGNIKLNDEIELI
ncbi:MOSC domain-containing protein [Eubacterium multiforme]|uniref:MOSC domain-containing protein YiiM n=1 Tax=Eubacterium multiforme TaxID=83339 RepID=A0ABT9UPK5_9FIRM|nr:MOSC domain-containing protein [Eubacterium multiforme]MDQ0148568.1 MOSC domain-containing protein YiiM [Eubacterium multiforme]